MVGGRKIGKQKEGEGEEEEEESTQENMMCFS